MLFLIVWTSAVICLAFGEEDYDSIRRAMENPDLFGGDMVVDMDADRSVIPQLHMRWPGARIPYVIDFSLRRQENLIKDAFKDFETRTCVRFEPRRPDQQNYVRLFYGQGCYSQIGMMGGQQMLSLGAGCLFVGTAIHELGHVLGFWHEQNRSDRDDYVEILLQNVQRGLEFNFRKFNPSENLLLTPFDYDSIMIYGHDAFSKNGKWTMKAKNDHPLLNPYSKQRMTESDIKRINKMYCGAP